MKYRKKPVMVEAVQLNERCLIEEDWFLGCSDKE